MCQPTAGSSRPWTQTAASGDGSKAPTPNRKWWGWKQPAGGEEGQGGSPPAAQLSDLTVAAMRSFGRSVSLALMAQSISTPQRQRRNALLNHSARQAALVTSRESTHGGLPRLVPTTTRTTLRCLRTSAVLRAAQWFRNGKCCAKVLFSTLRFVENDFAMGKRDVRRAQSRVCFALVPHALARTGEPVSASALRTRSEWSGRSVPLFWRPLLDEHDRLVKI